MASVDPVVSWSPRRCCRQVCCVEINPSGLTGELPPNRWLFRGRGQARPAFVVDREAPECAAGAVTDSRCGGLFRLDSPRLGGGKNVKTNRRTALGSPAPYMPSSELLQTVRRASNDNLVLLVQDIPPLNRNPLSIFTTHRNCTDVKALPHVIKVDR